MQFRNNRIPMPSADEPLYEWFRRVGDWSRRALERHRRRRAAACIRCGDPGRVICRACGARLCNRCWILSIETGTPSILCLECTATGAVRPAMRSAPAELLRVGARTVGWWLLAVAAVGLWRHGIAGLWRLVAFLLQPAALLGAVPLALVVGAARVALGRAIAAALAGKGASFLSVGRGRRRDHPL